MIPKIEDSLAASKRPPSEVISSAPTTPPANSRAEISVGLSVPSIDLSFLSVADNIACDEALLVQAEEAGGGPVIRFWELDHLAVVLGASCRIRENVRVEACHAAGVPIGRRSSGGGTVVIGPGALSVTVVLPLAAEPVAFASVDTAQRFILERIAQALRACGPEVVMLGSGDLTLHGRKFSGSAQRRLRQHLMVHASILYDFDLTAVDRFTTMPPRQPAYRANRPHADFVVNLPLSRATIVAAISSVWGSQVGSGSDFRVPLDRVADLSRRKFGEFGWIERL